MASMETITDLISAYAGVPTMPDYATFPASQSNTSRAARAVQALAAYAIGRDREESADVVLGDLLADMQHLIDTAPDAFHRDFATIVHAAERCYAEELFEL